MCNNSWKLYSYSVTLWQLGIHCKTDYYKSFSQNQQNLVYFRQQDTSTLARYLNENVQQQYSVHDRKPRASHN